MKFYEVLCLKPDLLLATPQHLDMLKHVKDGLLEPDIDVYKTLINEEGHMFKNASRKITNVWPDGANANLEVAHQDQKSEWN